MTKATVTIDLGAIGVADEHAPGPRRFWTVALRDEDGREYSLDMTSSAWDLVGINAEEAAREFGYPHLTAYHWA